MTNLNDDLIAEVSIETVNYNEPEPKSINGDRNSRQGGDETNQDEVLNVSRA